MKTTTQFDPVKLALYRHHVINKTIPTGWRKLLTLTGIEQYRHKSAFDDYVPRPPAYPAWTNKKAMVSVPVIIPEATDYAEYIREFNELNHLKG